MRYIIAFLLLFALGTFTFGQTNTLTGKWKLDSCNWTTSLFDERDHDGKHIFTIDFVNDTLLNIKMTLNECLCIYHLDSNKIKISFKGESGLCTQICCDTELSRELYNMLRSIENGYLKNDKLIFADKQDILIFIKEK
jgi:hypothetical protein